MLLTVLMPDQTQVQLVVADNELVFDGSDFWGPQRVKYVILLTMPVAAVSLPFDDIASTLLQAEVRIRALVLNREPDPETQTDPQLLVASDPGNGTCVCFVTYTGTELRFVKVHKEL